MRKHLYLPLRSVQRLVTSSIIKPPAEAGNLRGDTSCIQRKKYEFIEVYMNIIIQQCLYCIADCIIGMLMYIVVCSPEIEKGNRHVSMFRPCYMVFDKKIYIYTIIHGHLHPFVLIYRFFYTLSPGSK